VRLLAVLFVLLIAACGPSQECRDYVACQLAYDPSVEEDLLDYKDDGRCWNNLQSAQLCTAQCREALVALREVSSPPPECLGD
jgi:hypothetical protein